MTRACLVLLALAGCSDELPAPILDPTVSNIWFHGDIDDGVTARTYDVIAVGGLRTFRLQWFGLQEPAFPYAAVVEGDAFRVESQQGSLVTVRALSPGSGTLRALSPDGSELTALDMKAAELQRVHLISVDGTVYLENIPAGTLLGPTAFAPGDRPMEVTLTGPGNERLFEDSVRVEIAGAEHLSVTRFRFANAVTGTYPITVFAGGETRTIDFVVTDQADSLTARAGSATSLHPDQAGTVCFDARAAGHYILHLPWVVSADGPVSSAANSDRNCMTVKTAAASGTIAITATAGGLSTTVTLPIVP